jgi:hypothetical protein
MEVKGADMEGIEEKSVKDLARRLALHANELYGAGLDTSELAEEFASLFHEERIDPSPDGTFGQMVGRYAIRPDDLKLFDAVIDGLAAAASANWMAAGIAILRLVHRVLTKGARLEVHHIRVLTILRCNVRGDEDDGMTADEILEVFHRTEPDKNLAWVKECLLELSECPNIGGGISKLVTEAPKGRWRPQV